MHWCACLDPSWDAIAFHGMLSLSPRRSLRWMLSVAVVVLVLALVLHILAGEMVWVLVLALELNNLALVWVLEGYILWWVVVLV